MKQSVKLINAKPAKQGEKYTTCQYQKQEKWHQYKFYKLCMVRIIKELMEINFTI